jgi:hypothetical protein
MHRVHNLFPTDCRARVTLPSTSPVPLAHSSTTSLVVLPRMSRFRRRRASPRARSSETGNEIAIPEKDRWDSRAARSPRARSTILRVPVSRGIKSRITTMLATMRTPRDTTGTEISQGESRSRAEREHWPSSRLALLAGYLFALNRTRVGRVAV